MVLAPGPQVGVAAAQSNTTQTNVAQHDRSYWRQISGNDFKVPEGSSADFLAQELSELLGSPDRELRDRLAYEILTAWIYKTHALDVQAIRNLMREWERNLEHLPDNRPDAVLRRSFSALMLSVGVARDNSEPFLENAEFRHLWNVAIDYLASENDLRGFDPRLGWIHATAHTADLLKFLARSRYITRDDQRVLLNAIHQKLTKANMVFTYGEDERLARTVLSLVARSDFDAEEFDAWTKSTQAMFPADHEPSDIELRANQNVKNLLSKLEVLLVDRAEKQTNPQLALNSVRNALKETF